MSLLTDVSTFLELLFKIGLLFIPSSGRTDLSYIQLMISFLSTEHTKIIIQDARYNPTSQEICIKMSLFCGSCANDICDPKVS